MFKVLLCVMIQSTFMMSGAKEMINVFLWAGNAIFAAYVLQVHDFYE